ncbi:hypothetical protein [Vreelandella nigrificans]|uniref:Uncharacterized protein n=1 Tax=Vreelandella nigrificans TaxID=2042704 RepID=A0A2A4HFX5_9GAMM|nr:hypothetical protein [Halomonas nigrificans]PCF93622.1 hypothetical protein CPA45_21360 [Halomonas nigrificans]
MNDAMLYQKPKLLTYCLPAATLLLNWWAAVLFIITLLAICGGTLYGLMSETDGIWMPLLLSIIVGSLLHSAITVMALAISVAAKPTPQTN